MTRIDTWLPVPVLIFATACSLGTATSIPISEERSDDSEVNRWETTDTPAGSDADLQARGAFRVNECNETASEFEDPWLTLTIQTQGIDGEWWAVSAGGSLRSGEIIVVDVKLYRPVYIYIVNVDASGKSTLLYPDVGSERGSLLGTGVHRLPPVDSEFPYIKLDSDVGWEYIFVIATPVPVATIDDTLGRLVGRLKMQESPTVVTQGSRRSSGKRSSAVTQPQRQLETRVDVDDALFAANAAAIPELSSRGGYRSHVEGAAIDARGGIDNVAVVPFLFKHI